MLDVIPETVHTRKTKVRVDERHSSRDRSSKNGLDDRPTSGGSVGSNSMDLNDIHTYLYYEDILDVVSSCNDAHHPPKNIFINNSNTIRPRDKTGKIIEKSCWTSTGLLPQFYKIHMIEKWIFTKV